MTTSVKNVIIGFGKAGKTLAAFLGNQGEETVLVEKSPVMYGGTCINVGCIPSKKLATLAGRKAFNDKDAATYYEESVQDKKKLISALNNANYHKVADAPNVTVVDGVGHFVDAHTVAVDTADGVVTYEAERIFINTGATPFIPSVKGLEVGGPIHTSETIMNLEQLPKELVIIGSGFIGLEFASTYAQFGSKVTVVDIFDTFLPREDEDVASAVRARLEEMGVSFNLGIRLEEVQVNGDEATVVYSKDGETHSLHADAVLVATGRKANTQALDLEKAGVVSNERGAIPVNEHLQTNVPHIFALGDVNGGPQFTFVSLDDFRVVKSFLFGDGSYTTAKRAMIPTSTFLSPTVASVGLNEKAAAAANIPVRVAKLPMTAVPKAKILGNQTGFYKVLVRQDSDEIVGATLFANEAHEVINIIATAMNGHIPYTVLRDQIFTHPTMAEALNDVFGMIH